MIAVLQTLGDFFLLMLVAMFVENTIFSRGIGLSRLVKLVTDSPVDSIIFCSLLTLIQVMSAPLGFFASQALAASGWWFQSYLRPLAFVLCAIVAFVLAIILINVFRLPQRKEMMNVLPMATFNCAVLGPMLLSGVQNFTFVQTMGFALGSALGYGFAVILLSEGQRKLGSKKVPAPFRGLPINLLYLGILALAIYGLTGHRVAF